MKVQRQRVGVVVAVSSVPESVGGDADQDVTAAESDDLDLEGLAALEFSG